MLADRVFIDTNIWVYAHLREQDETRHQLARQCLLGARPKVISPQVVFEYYSVMLRNRQDDDWIQTNLRTMFGITELQPTSAAVVNTALMLRRRYALSVWDCQIAASALHAGCSTLLTEDLQDGQVLNEQLTVVNPLRTS